MVGLEHTQAKGIGRVPQTENFRGSDATAKVITLTNSSLSSKEIVTLNGQVMTITEDYTVSHLAASSTITFVDALDAADFITVRYYT
ncbi:MAG: hypothetical protein ACTSQY_03295 [Candidatus Odinarchaeia archaeon]